MDQIGADGRSITLIHFVYSTGGDHRIACMPNMTEFHQTQYHRNHHRTNDPRAATCPQCKRTPEYVAAMEAVGSTQQVREVNRGQARR